MPRHTSCIIAAAALLSLGCREEESRIRGRGLEQATLPVVQQVQIYTAALRASFDLGPALTLLLDPVMLPGDGYGAGDTLAPVVRDALLASPAFEGICRPDRDSDRARVRGSPICQAQRSGYVVRVSEIFRTAGDTVQTYAFSERYNTPSSRPVEQLRLEEAYQLVRRNGSWRVVRKARIRTR